MEREANFDDVRPRLPVLKTRFLDQVRDSIRKRGLAYATEKTYVQWIIRFIRFSGMRHPRELAEDDVGKLLSFLADRQSCSAATQRVALNALVFLYAHHFGKPLENIQFSFARKKTRVPTAFTHSEAIAVLEHLRGVDNLIAGLMYGGGLRLAECLNLRVKDIDFGAAQITVRHGKGGADRFTLLPESLIDRLQQQIITVEKLHAYDLSRGFGSVYLPDAFMRKDPQAATATAWQFLFPSQGVGVDPRSGVMRRHHRHATSVQRAVKYAIEKSGFKRRASSHTFRHSFATRLIETGYDIKLVQSLMGHRDIRTTEIYLHIVRNRSGAIRSPMDH